VGEGAGCQYFSGIILQTDSGPAAVPDLQALKTDISCELEQYRPAEAGRLHIRWINDAVLPAGCV
jgi:hypothetical protein